MAEKIKALRAEIDKQSSQSMTTDMFISLVRKYTRARKLTAPDAERAHRENRSVQRRED